MSIDWSNPKSKISKFFTVGEATYLPKLKEYYKPTEEEKQNIINTALKLDKVRELLNNPIIVTVWIRPINHISNGNIIDYNKLIGGAAKSAHITGEAVDFVCTNLIIDEVLDIIQPKCEEYGFALENNGSIERIAQNGGSGGPRLWTHFQSRPLKDGSWRMFNP